MCLGRALGCIAAALAPARRRLRLGRAIGCVAAALAWPAFAGLTQPVASYDITARLDPEGKAVQGSQVLTWVNTSAVPVPELQFHLYMNAFKSEKTTFMRESRGQSRGFHEDQRRRGWIEVKKLALAGGADLTKAIRFIQPDDGNRDDQTVIAVTLPQPVAPGASIRLVFDFYTRLPKVFARTGYHGDFFFVAQWFPKIGVWQNGGWNCHQFHAASEFFADFGRYAVEVTVPANYVVGATGALESRLGNTYRFVQEDVHDFAWTASPRFQRHERPGPGGVRMILLIQPEHASQTERHFRALHTAIDYFGRWYGPYPYPTITLVDPPYGGGGAGGMEYPTLITGGTSYFAPEDEQSPEMVIVHEYGHQYWYGMVASNEFEEAWLDEGINTYSTGNVLDAAYPPGRIPVRFAGLPVGGWLGLPRLQWNAIDRTVYLMAPDTDALARPAWQFYDFSSYGVNSYMKPGVVLRTLERHLGRPVMDRILRTYFERWRFRHPTTADFQQVAEEVSGRDLDAFFNQFIYGAQSIDYRVADLDVREVPDSKPKRYESTVRIVRDRDAVLPVEVRFRFEDGRTETRAWDGQYRWTKFDFTRPARLDSVEVDPHRKNLLDTGFANNSRTREPNIAPLAKFCTWVLFWAQNLLLLSGGLV